MTSEKRRYVHVALASLVLLALVQLGILFEVIFERIGYPFDLEWMEGGMLCHALRLLEAKPLYAPPSHEFISYLYPPLYPALVAAGGSVFGLSYALARTISTIALILSLVLIVATAVKYARDRTSGIACGIIGAGIYATTYKDIAGWFDLARNDSTYLMLVAGGLFLLEGKSSTRRIICAGALLGLAGVTKQTAIFFILYGALSVLASNRSQLFAFIASTSCTIAAFFLPFVLHHPRWAWLYLVGIHQQHEISGSRFIDAVQSILPRMIGFSLIFVIVAAGLIAFKSRVSRHQKVNGERDTVNISPLWFWSGATAVAIVTSAIGFSTQWAVENAFMPGVYFVSLLTALLSLYLVNVSRHRWLGIHGVIGATALTALLGIQLTHNGYHWAKPLRPTAQMLEAGDRLIQRIRSIDGPVLIPYHPYYAVMAGKRPSHHKMGVNDLNGARKAYPIDLKNRIEKRDYAAIIYDRPIAHPERYITKHYKLSERIPKSDAPQTLNGFRVRPQYIYRPR